MRQLKRELLNERPKEAPYTAADVPAPAVILVLGGFLLTLFFDAAGKHRYTVRY